MMRGLHYDSKLINKTNEIVDFILVNLLFLVLCLPVFTIGAAKSALYATAFSYLEHQKMGVSIFWKAFRENFRSITPLYLLLFAVGAFFVLELCLVLANHIPLYAPTFIILTVVFTLYLSFLNQVFLFQSYFHCTKRQLLRNGFLTVLSHPLRAVMILGLDIIPIVLPAIYPPVLVVAAIAFFLGHYTVTAYWSARLMHKLFLRYSDAKASSYA